MHARPFERVACTHTCKSEACIGSDRIGSGVGQSGGDSACYPAAHSPLLGGRAARHRLSEPAALHRGAAPRPCHDLIRKS
eukprot:1000550-Rhodomonas_salina.1